MSLIYTELPSNSTLMKTTSPMSEKTVFYEHLLHWIWETLRFDLSNLTTVGGQSLKIFNQGSPNKSDGPDFLNACLQIETLKWYGDIEIHWNEQDWAKHGHQSDSNYDRVVLHVVYEPVAQTTISRSDGSGIPTLCLKPNLMHSLQYFLDQSRKTSALPCKEQVTYISEQAFKSQIEKAHREYFEQKVDDLMAFYDPSLSLSKAWKRMVLVALFDGLGISHNREPMQKLAGRLFKNAEKYSSSEQLIAGAYSISGIDRPGTAHSFGWNHKGCRPNNHPSIRIPQGAELLWSFLQIPFGDMFRKNISELWSRLHAQTNPDHRSGKQRRSILYGTVWLPAFFILGNLLNSKKLKKSAFNKWQKHRVRLPESLLKPYHSLSVPPEYYRSVLGSIHQLRNYCKPRNCQNCKVFKSVISS